MPRVIGMGWAYCVWCERYTPVTCWASWLGEVDVCDQCQHWIKERPDTDGQQQADADAAQDSADLHTELERSPWPPR